ncbi:MAG: ABC transporter permease [Campylobacterales bacterium]
MKTLLSKIAYAFLMLLLISAVSFVAVKAAPNNFLAAGELNPNITEESIKTLKEVYGLDKPPLEQYIGWVKSMASLEFGISFSTGKSVKDEILSRLPITLAINLVSMFFIFIFGIWLGIYAALRQSQRADKIATTSSLVSFAMPSFYLALLFIMFFSLYLSWFPISGVSSVTKEEAGALGYYADMSHHLFLPIAVIVITSFGSLALYIRSLTVEILKSDYVFFAVSRGVNRTKLITLYILPNLLNPIVTMLGLSLPGIIGGSVILESIFAINGMGLFFYQSVISRDYPVILGVTMIGAFLTLLGNILADVAVMKLNPFAKRG